MAASVSLGVLVGYSKLGCIRMLPILQLSTPHFSFICLGMRKHYGYADFFLNSDVSQRACKRAGKVTVQNDKIRVLLIALKCT